MAAAFAETIVVPVTGSLEFGLLQWLLKATGDLSAFTAVGLKLLI